MVPATLVHPDHNPGGKSKSAWWCVLWLGLLLSPACKAGEEKAQWQADHHMHLASADMCERVGDCLDTNHPPAVFAADAVHALEQAHVAKGVVISSAYLYGLSSLGLDSNEIAAWMRRENEFTAAEVAPYPDRLIGFLSVDPLHPDAIEEIRHWQGSAQLMGLKLHFTASGVDLDNAEHVARLQAVLAQAAGQSLPMIIHIGGGEFDGEDAESFIQKVLPSAGTSWVQIAHAGGGLPLHEDSQVQILRTFARHFENDDPLTQRVLFDVSYVPATEAGPELVAGLVSEMRRIGMNRMLFGSDFNILMPAAQIEAFERLDLTEEELQILRESCAPWVCH